MRPASPLKPRVHAAHQRRDLVPVAASSCLDRPMTPAIDPRDLLRCSAACMRASGAYHVETAAIGRRDGVPSAASADAAASAGTLDQAGQYLAQFAQDPGLLEFLRLRAAGYLAAYHPVRPLDAVVVAEHDAAPGGDQLSAKPSIWARAAAPVLRLVRRAA